MSEISNNPYKLHDVEAQAQQQPLSHSISSPLPRPNPFLDTPNAPPPAYNLHAESSNLLLPPGGVHTRPSSPSHSPFKSSDSEAYYRRQQYNKRRFVCFMVAIIIMIVVALVVAGVAFKWGRNNICVRWQDGTTSGNCNN